MTAPALVQKLWNYCNFLLQAGLHYSYGGGCSGGLGCC